ncbi:hypothetical protein QD46_21450 [Paenibacillus polymyxa]|uniref:hypothetical protein n=1 Tax=Paenibacillus polymyxa TaxID=1406 RepID=UPI0005CE586F|nr:hypothetical protein [Paenibacillus polymyxa]KJD38085.1 hypothetical protein QD46_21450 [Paenibacillus polymyxa]
MNYEVLYPADLLELVSSRFSHDMLAVFSEIWNRKETGIMWSELLKSHDRYIMEKALLVFEITGFVEVDIDNRDKRKKIYSGQNKRSSVSRIYI